MKKSKLVSLLVVLMFALTAQTVIAADLKVAFVNVDELFDGYDKTIELNEELDVQIAEKQAERDRYVQDIRRAKDEIVLLAEENKLEKQKAIDRKIKELQEFDRRTREEVQGIRNEFMKELLEELDEKVKVYGQKKKLDYILNGRLVLHADEKLDITKDLIADVNKEYKKSK